MMAVMSIYIVGSDAWNKGDQKAEVLGVIQALTLRITGEFQQSTEASLSVTSNGKAFSFLSPFDSDGNYTISTSDGSPVWQRFLVYSLQDGSVYRDEISLDSASPLRYLAAGIEKMGPPPEKELSDYVGSGRPVAGNISTFVIHQVPGTSLFELSVACSVDRSARLEAQKLELKTFMEFRN